MGTNSGIQWTHHTFNPWVGCQRVSPGCTNCYAESYDRRVGGVPKTQRADPSRPLLRWGPTAPRTRTSESYWRKPFAWDRAAKAAGERHRVFCASLADVFEDRDELAPWRKELWGLIHATSNLDWLLLTKRPENAYRMLPWWGGLSPWPNVWLGTTVEDQQRADERIPELIATPAAVRFLSCEPLIERVDLSPWLEEDQNGFVCNIDWVIVGGESGPGARPFNLEWARAIVKECRDAGRGDPRPFVKQLGAVPVVDTATWRSSEARYQQVNPTNYAKAPEGMQPLWFADSHAGDMAEWPEDLRVREFPEVRR